MDKLINMCKTFKRFCGPNYEVYENLKEIIICEPSLFGKKFVHSFYLLKGYKLSEVLGSQEYKRITENKRRDDSELGSQLKAGKIFIDGLIRKDIS